MDKGSHHIGLFYYSVLGSQSPRLKTPSVRFYGPSRDRVKTEFLKKEYRGGPNGLGRRDKWL